VNPRLAGYAAAVFGAADPADLSRLVTELDQVDRLLRTNDVLRTALVDTAVAPATRRAVVDDLLEGRVSEETRRLAAFAVGTAHSNEVPAAVAWLAHRARRLAAGDGSAITALGHLGARARVGGFAEALFEQMTTAELEEMEDELFRFGRTIETTSLLRAAMTDRDLPPEVRNAVAGDLLGGKVLPATLRLVEYLGEAGRARDVIGTLYWLVDRTAEARGWRVARVVAARPVDGEERERLAESLRELTGQDVELQVTVDEALLAGVRVRIGDLQVDATARARIDQLREHMAAMSGWEDHGYGVGRRQPTQGEEAN